MPGQPEGEGADDAVVPELKPEIAGARFIDGDGALTPLHSHPQLEGAGHEAEGVQHVIDRLLRKGVSAPAMLRTAMRPCSTAAGWMACTSCRPVEKSGPCATSPAA